jgi:hypothetical protein
MPTRGIEVSILNWREQAKSRFQTSRAWKRDLAIYHLSRKVIASQMPKINWLRRRLYERNSETGANTLNYEQHSRNKAHPQGSGHSPAKVLLRFASHPTTIAKAIGYANVGIALGRGIDRANQGFPLLQAQRAEDAPSRMLRGAYPRPPHPRYETADLAMIRQGI